MNSFKLFQVDAFTSQPYRGNPAGVCILSQPVNDEWMRSLASEMNLSETAFILPEGEGFRLRWFTPLVEVDLCGHATLASSHILFEQGYLPANQPAIFETRSGRLTAIRSDDWITLDFPTKSATPVHPDPEILAALGLKDVVAAGKSQFDLLVEVENEMIVRDLQPDFTRLKSLPARGVIVTSRSSTSEFDFVSRFFAPAVGVNEDPVTGSAHCVLAPYWHEKLDKPDMLAYQASTRGGILRIHHRSDRTLLQGKAVTVFSADLTSMAYPA